jgi:integrase
MLVHRHKPSQAEIENAGLIAKALDLYATHVGRHPGLAVSPVALAKAGAVLARKGRSPAAVSAAVDAYARRAEPPDYAVLAETLRAVYAGQDEAAREERYAEKKGGTVKETRKKLPRGIRLGGDGQLVICATNPQHKLIRQTVTWKLVKELGVTVDSASRLAQPGLKLAQDALVAVKAKFLAEKKTGAVAASSKTKIGDCYRLIENEYVQKGRKSLPDLKERWAKHLSHFFAHLSVGELTTDVLDEYVRKRLNDKKKPSKALINRELAIIRHALTLGQETTPPKVLAIPKFPRLRENAARQGFLSDKHYDNLARECAAEGVWLRAMFATACNFAWRRGEVVNLQVRQLDFPARTVRLDVGATKNNDGRVVRMTNEVYGLLSVCAANKEPEDYVFTRDDGQRVLDFREAWKNACARAGVPRLLFHDLRRTGARNLRRLHVSETVIMKIGGWKTANVFKRYDIVDEADLADAASCLDDKRAAMDEEARTDKKTDKPTNGSAQEGLAVQ